MSLREYTFRFCLLVYADWLLTALGRIFELGGNVQLHSPGAGPCFAEKTHRDNSNKTSEQGPKGTVAHPRTELLRAELGLRLGDS